MMSIAQLRHDIEYYSPDFGGEYNTRMYHKLPNAEVIDRTVFVLSKCIDKVVLDVGCAGLTHKDIQKVAKKAYGIDKVLCKTPNFIIWDFDKSGGKFPYIEDSIELVFCGEIMEHLPNPGLFLEGLNQFKCSIIFTVPNAFSLIHPSHIKKGMEHVNIDHVCYYSWHTFKVLLEKYKYKINEFYWYDNPNQIVSQGFNEGCVFVTEYGN